jgi:predicted DNA-binding transcriptional regulator AlpA
MQLELVMETKPEDLLTSAQVAKMLDVTPTTVSIWAGQGYFPNAYRINPRTQSAWRIPKGDVDAFIEERRQQRGYFYRPINPPDSTAE